MRIMGISLGVALLVLCVGLQTAAQQQTKRLAVTGKLTRAMGIGGESSGWLIQFDSEMTIDGKPAHSIEVAGPTEKFQALENKNVKAKGKLGHRHGVERGDWPVLDVSSIKEVKRKKATASD